MRKPSQLITTIFLVLPLLAGCHPMQSPTKDMTVTGPGSGPGSYVQPTQTRGGNRSGSDYGSTVIDNPNASANTTDLTVRPGDTLPPVDWDHPPADMIVATVYFGFDQFNIQPEYRTQLEAAAKVLAGDKTMQVVAVGHCDWYGSDQYNLALSDRRANSVKAYLTQLGADSSQAQVLARGKYGSVPDVKKDSSQAKNDRRVDIIKIPAGVTLPSGPPPAGGATPAGATGAPASAATTSAM
ncbi:MAG TPA: OmpA family protein [Opitutales bacterium]|jgi:peptidoglycan-associated lipoprotein|nr:OmpA family protein [Opitutales bacterium]